jgi:hypothetical protein
MSDLVLFQMGEPARQSLIAGHLFYVAQARKRLFSQFDNMEAEAHKAAEEWLERSNCRFDPDRHDPADFQEAAYEVGIEFYGLLSDMQTQTWLSVVAGMFHEWDKQLREWLVREVERWHNGENVPQKIWTVDFRQMFELLDCLNWNFSKTADFNVLDACRVVVNVYKHGDGKSLDDLKKKYPEYLDSPFSGSVEHCNHTRLQVSEDQFQKFSDAVVAFWKAIPENTFASAVNSLPNWFEKAASKDQGTP